MARGAWINPAASRISFKDWTASYLSGAVNKRASTRARDEDVLRAHWLPALGRRPIGAITPLDVRRVIEALNVDHASSSVHTVYAVLQSVMSAAVDAELIPRTPCRGIPLPQLVRKKDIRFLTPGSWSAWPRPCRISTEQWSI